jgi:subtilisin family serine protease
MKKWIFLTLILTLSTAFALPVRQGSTVRVHDTNEYIVKLKHRYTSRVSLAPLFKTRVIAQKYIRHNVMKVTTAEKIYSTEFRAVLGNPYIDWISPNYSYLGNAMESTVDFYNWQPNDPLFNRQEHLKIIQAPAAWEIEPGQAEIIVAVTDNGFELEHEDLQGGWWKNKGEIPNNGKDDDGNGYVDDYDAWNFSANNNNPRPGSNSHGTHVAGTIMGRADNGMGIAGVAPGVVVMPIKFYGDGRWTSEIISKSYHYAVDNGARIITTSYNIDGMVNDKAYIDAVNYVYEKGGLLFNSAGNSGRDNPTRIKNKQVILVCATQSNYASRANNDVIAKFSNYGTGIDVCAPGNPVYATVNGGKYADMSGTSMASPVAAATAALIWSKYPTWTNMEVLKKLLETSDNIDNKNSSKKGKLGAGRVNALNALQ